jgi:hypothetical protein
MQLNKNNSNHTKTLQHLHNALTALIIVHIGRI